MLNSDININEFPSQYRPIADRLIIGELLNLYMLAFDEDGMDEAWARSIFTEDVELTFPVGRHKGIASLGDFHREIARKWELTLHLGTNYIIDIDGDEAKVRANLLAIQVHTPEARLAYGEKHKDFFVAGKYHGVLARGVDGWRIRQLDFHVSWIKGKAPLA